MEKSRTRSNGTNEKGILSEIKGLKKEIDLLKLQIQEEVKEKYALFKRIKKLTKNGKNRTNNT